MNEQAGEEPRQSEIGQVLDYASPRTSSDTGPIFLPERSWTSRIIPFVIFGGFLLLLAAILLPALTTRRTIPTRTVCGADLHQIGIALFTYAKSNGGQLPDSWESAILAPGLMSPQRWAILLVCPGSQDTPAPGVTAQQIAANLHSLGRPIRFLNSKTPPPLHVSYIYLGKGLAFLFSANLHRQVLAFEPPEHHPIGKDLTINTLWTDGSVRTYTFGVIQMQKLMSEFQAGQNPPATLKAIDGLP